MLCEKYKYFFLDGDGTYRSNVSELKGGSVRQKILCIILTCLVFNTGLIFSTVVHSEALTKVDEETGRYLDNLGASQHGQTSVNYNFEQHGSQHSQDSMNQRNSPRWDAVVVNLRDTSGRPVYLREIKKNRSTPSDPSRYNQVNDPHDEPDGRPVLLVPIKEW